MRDKKKWMNIVIVMLFFITLYLVEVGGRGVARYNGGYGTFDMKPYNTEIVYSVLPEFTNGGVSAAKKYYICDYLFICSFLAFQVMLSTVTYKNIKSQIPRYLFVAVAIIRAIADAIENALLYYIISTYPTTHNAIVNVSYIFTQVKLGMIPIWCALLIIGILCNFIRIKPIKKRVS